MSTTDKDTQTIAVDYDLPHPPEKVWSALTESNLLAAWLMANDFRPVVGHRFAFTAQPMGDWDGVVHCEVLEVVPNERLRYTWRGKNPAGEWRLDTVVTWTLARTLEGTRLHLDHAGFQAPDRFAFEAMSKGWSGHIAERLGKFLTGN
jgi:uncharacterized protein YndB with AHSA1/START domain